MTSSTRRTAASAKIAAWRIGTDVTLVSSAVEAFGCLLGWPVYCRRGARTLRRRNVARDDFRHGGTSRLGGS
jgi:hypothetical protein